MSGIVYARSQLVLYGLHRVAFLPGRRQLLVTAPDLFCSQQDGTQRQELAFMILSMLRGRAFFSILGVSGMDR